MGNSQPDSPDPGQRDRNVGLGLDSTDPPVMPSRKPVSKPSCPSPPRTRTIHLTGFFCQPGDRDYALAAKATGTKDNQDVYWFREGPGDMMWDKPEVSALYSPETEDLPELISDPYKQLSEQLKRRALEQAKTVPKRNAVVDIISEVVVDKNGKRKSAGDEASAEQLSETQLGSKKVANSRLRKVRFDEVDNTSVATSARTEAVEGHNQPAILNDRQSKKPL